MNTIKITTIIAIFAMFTSCKKEATLINNQESIELNHIKQLDSELSILAKAFSDIFKDDANVKILKRAIFEKKKDENISIKDFYKFYDANIKHQSNSRNQSLQGFEYLLYSTFRNYSSMSIEEFTSFINKYDMAIYWEFIELWDGIKKPSVGYPIDEEEDVNHNYDLLSYKILLDTGNVKSETVVQNTYLQENPVILIRPMEDFENNSPEYYSNEPYVWLSDLESEINVKNKTNGKVDAKIQGVDDRFRLENINTNGNKFDGNGGPEFRFFRNGPWDYKTGNYGFAEIININLTASVAESGNWVNVSSYANNIYHDLWLFTTWNQLTGTYEEDGGIIINQTVSGFAIEGILNVVGIPVASASIGVSSKISRKDDLIDKYQMNWTSFVNNVKLKQNWGWGFYIGLPIRRTDHTDLKVTYNNY